MRSLLCAAAALAALAAPHLAAAQDSGASFRPRFHGEIPMEVQTEVTFAADGDNERWLTGALIEPYVTLGLTDRLALETGLILEQVKGPEPGESAFFESHGLYVEQLKLTWTGEALSAYAGKFNPAFGIAWDKTPGIWNDEFTGDYEMTERLGLGGAAQIGGGRWGTHTFGAAAFFTDTTFLSGSVLTGRGKTDLSDGGPGNTEDLSSFTLTLDSETPASLAGLTTHLAFRHQAPGDRDPAGESENGFAAGARYEFPVGARYTAAIVGEYAGFSDFDAAPGDARYLTLGGEVVVDRRWDVHTTWTGRRLDPDGADSIDDHMILLGAGYNFDNGLRLDGGYLYKQEDDVDSHTIGTKLSYNFSF